MSVSLQYALGKVGETTRRGQKQNKTINPKTSQKKHH